jgi:hypothetical protein
MSMVRRRLQVSILLACLALTALFLAWPREGWEVTGGSVEVRTKRSAIETQYRVYGLMKYLTVMEHCGIDEPYRRSIHLDRPRAVLTGALTVTVWTAFLKLAFRHRVAASGASAAA